MFKQSRRKFVPLHVKIIRILINLILLTPREQRTIIQSRGINSQNQLKKRKNLRSDYTIKFIMSNLYSVKFNVNYI